MKSLSIRNPWAHLILTGEKTIECRTWRTNYRGDLLICSSANPKIKDTLCGYAIGVVTLADVTPFKREHLQAACLDGLPDQKCYAWHFENWRDIKPFAVKGKLNFFETDDAKIEYLPAEMTDEEADAAFEKYFEPYFYNGRK